MPLLTSWGGGLWGRCKPPPLQSRGAAPGNFWILTLPDDLNRLFQRGYGLLIKQVNEFKSTQIQIYLNAPISYIAGAPEISWYLQSAPKPCAACASAPGNAACAPVRRGKWLLAPEISVKYSIHSTLEVYALQNANRIISLFDDLTSFWILVSNFAIKQLSNKYQYAASNNVPI